MRTFRKFTVVMITTVSLLTLMTGVALAQDPENGKVLWEEQVFQCQKCHGASGEGAWAGPLAGGDQDVEAWLTQVRTPRQNMPSFSPEQVSDEMIIDMQAYITSLPKPDGFTPMDAGLPDDAPAGQTLLVEKRCVACHGTTGPIKEFIERGETPTAERVIAQLRTPFRAMPTFNESKVSDAEATLIAEFMASQMPPDSLPQSGGITTNSMVTWLLLGGGLVLLGFTLRRLMVNRQ